MLRARGQSLRVSAFILLVSLLVYLMYADLIVSGVLFACGVLIVLMALLAYFNVRGNDLFSPLNWFSLIYSGYAIGAVYYSFGNAEYGKFIALAGMSEAESYNYLEWAAIWATLSYVFFLLGYGYFNKAHTFTPSLERTPWVKFLDKSTKLVVPLMLLIGGGYWVYLANSLSGGILNLLVDFSAFPHLIEEAKGTTLPYNLYYAGIFIWLYNAIVNGKKIGIAFYLFSFVGLVINLSQGRIMNSITFVLTQVAFFYMANRSQIDIKSVRRYFRYIFIAFFFAFVVMFARISSSLNFNGEDAAFLSLDELGASLRIVGAMIIGWGNIADLQQLALIFKAWTGEYFYGASYFDWFNNLFGKLYGAEPTSVGLKIKAMYFPNESGPPTPGAIGEAYANFGFLGLIFMFFVGAFFARIYYWTNKSGSALVALLYAMFLMRFVLLYAKVDSTSLANLFLTVVPFGLLLIPIFVVYRLGKTKNA